MAEDMKTELYLQLFSIRMFWARHSFEKSDAFVYLYRGSQQNVLAGFCMSLFLSTLFIVFVISRGC